jgi:excisionase family DNA binding protein
MLNVKEVAILLGVHKNTVYIYLQKGLLRGTKLGGGNIQSRHHWRIAEEELKRFIEGGK